MKEYTTGNAKVDLMAQIQLTGNVTPQIWYKTITKESGKPHLLAIAILSDIVYWYRPAEIRDESTGHITGYRKRFHTDMLQRSYDQFAELFGESKRSVTDAVVRLEALGVVRREFRTVEIGGMRYNNVLFIDLFPEQLYRLTYPGMQEPDRMQEPDMKKEAKTEKNCPPPPTKFRERGHGNQPLSRESVGGITEKSAPSHKISGEGSQNFGTRNTENITEITSSSSAPSNISASEAGCTDDDESVPGYCAEDSEQGCVPEIKNAVFAELKKYGQTLPEHKVLRLCQNISLHASGDIANMSAYIQKCIANMILAQKLSEVNADHRIRAENSFLQQTYGTVDWDAFEQNIISN